MSLGNFAVSQISQVEILFKIKCQIIPQNITNVLPCKQMFTS